MNGITTRAATTGDVPFLTDVFRRALRDAISATRGRWDETRETAQFLQQLERLGFEVVSEFPDHYRMCYRREPSGPG